MTLFILYSKAKNVKKRKLNDLQTELADLAKKLKKTEDTMVTESVSLSTMKKKQFTIILLRN